MRKPGIRSTAKFNTPLSLSSAQRAEVRHGPRAVDGRGNALREGPCVKAWTARMLSYSTTFNLSNDSINASL